MRVQRHAEPDRDARSPPAPRGPPRRERLTGLDLALGQRPVVVALAMDDHDLGAAGRVLPGSPPRRRPGSGLPLRSGVRLRLARCGSTAESTGIDPATSSRRRRLLALIRYSCMSSSGLPSSSSGERDPGAVGLQLPGRRALVEGDVEQLADLADVRRVGDRGEHLDAAVEVAVHQVGRADARPTAGRRWRTRTAGCARGTGRECCGPGCSRSAPARRGGSCRCRAPTGRPARRPAEAR